MSYKLFKIFNFTWQNTSLLLIDSVKLIYPLRVSPLFSFNFFLNHIYLNDLLETLNLVTTIPPKLFWI